MLSENVRNTDSKHLGYALLCSLALHGVVFVKLPQHIEPDLHDEIYVSLLEEQKTVTPQIISENEAKPETPDIETPYRYERDARTDQEQIRRGLPATQQAPPAATIKSVVEPILRLSSGELEQKLRDPNEATPSENEPDRARREKPSDPERVTKLNEYQPFSQPFSSSRLGSPDYLRTIPDGEITLLNAKADHFAVFVRRVALQVFGALRKHNWQQVPFSETRRVEDFVTVEAVLDLNGKLLSVKLTDSSGSHVFDKVLLRAAQDGAWDQNPPPGAQANDGKIHFIFKSRIWSRRMVQVPSEERWLLLSTGLR